VAPEIDRPLLTGGEELRHEVERVAGFGPKFHPWTVEAARASIRPQIVALEAAVRGIPESLRGDRIVLEATIVPNYIAASYFPERLFDEADLVVLGSRPAVAPYRTEGAPERLRPTKALILGGTSRTLAALDRLAAEDHPNRRERRVQEGFQRLQDLRLPRPQEVVRGEGADAELYEAVLHPAWDPVERRVVPASAATYQKWISYVASLGGEVVARYRRAVSGLTFVPVRLPPAQAPRAASFNPLRVLRPMPKLRPIPSLPLRSVRGLPTPLPPADATPLTNQRVAVFDGGWDPACRFTAPFTTLHDLTPVPPDVECVEHGSVVTAAALFGRVEPTERLPRPVYFVDHYRVLPVPPTEVDFDLNWVLDRIVETVRSSGHRVVNLSLGPDLAVDDGEPHRWTAELDQLAAELDVLFVVAVGNNGEADPVAGLNRIQVPADMVNGLAVGACTDGADAAGWTRSPFSAVGPGRQGARVKPTGVAFGGDGALRTYVGLGRGGVWYEGHGTSFATPLVTRSVGALLPYVSRTGSCVNFLRAMAVHFADPPGEGTPIEQVGHGRFQSRLEAELACTTDSVTVMYEDVLRRGETVGLPVPLPTGLVRGRVAMRWTLAVTSPVDPSDMAEYTSAGVELQFRPHARRIPFTAPDNSKVVVVNVDTNGAKATDLLRQGYRPGENPATRSGKRVRVSEFARRDEGKWETLIHTRDRMTAASLCQPRLDLSYFARAGGVLRDEGVPDLDFTLLVTIDAPPSFGLYDRIRNEYPVLSPIDLRIRPRVRVS
jgi:nucleotide-binding universal stress UspA family protein